MSDIISLGLWIKRRRKALDLTQDTLAALVGCSKELIAKIEGDARRPSREIATLLATHLQLAADERVRFIQVARAELGADRLAPPAQSVARGAFVPAQAVSSAANMSGHRRSTRPNNLLTPPTALIGRETELAHIADRLQDRDCRLLTLTGPGGVGKTRLGLQVGADLLEDFTDGVYFVDLAPVRDPKLVSGAIAQTLGVRESGGQPLLERLKHELRDKHMLLLLDNFEHLLDAAAHVAELLAATARLRLLVTSRERLHLRGEQEVAVPPLALPDPAHLPAFDQVSQYAAIALFMARAQASQPNFQLTSANAPAIAEICVRLDGLPLALELAAARLKLFAPEALLARLSGRLALLRGGARDLPERQQTMRTTIAWSYDLLTEAEQTLFRRLGVFVGGCTLEAAEAVCGDKETRRQADEATEQTHAYSLSPDLLVSLSVLDGIAALVDKSLLRQIAGPGGDQPRFAMLETIREYALEQLEVSGEVEQLRWQHALYYLRLSEEGSPGWDRNDRTWARRMDREYDNLWSALAWSQTSAGDSEVELRLASTLGSLWRGARHEAIAALERTLNHPLGVGRTASHAQARVALAQLFALTGNFAAARAQYEQAMPLWRELGDTQQYAHILERLGWVAREQGDSATAWARMTESLAISRELGDAPHDAGILTSMAAIAILEEDPARAEALLAESRVVAQQVDVDCNTIFWTLNHLGHAAQLRGAYDRAAQLHQESLSLLETDTSPWAATLAAYRDLGETAVGLGRPEEAVRWLAQGLAASRMLGEQPFTAWCLASLGSAAALGEEAERAARLWGAAERLRSALGCRPAPAARATYERAVAAARAQLGEEAFAAVWAEGRAMTLEQAIAYALEVGTADSAEPASAVSPTQ
jgi:predicted ATPase/transcriptional regulator with XRE-family HTH domain